MGETFWNGIREQICTVYIVQHFSARGYTWMTCCRWNTIGTLLPVAKRSSISNASGRTDGRNSLWGLDASHHVFKTPSGTLVRSQNFWRQIQSFLSFHSFGYQSRKGNVISLQGHGLEVYRARHHLHPFIMLPLLQISIRLEYTDLLSGITTTYTV